MKKAAWILILTILLWGMPVYGAEYKVPTGALMGQTSAQEEPSTSAPAETEAPVPSKTPQYTAPTSVGKVTPKETPAPTKKPVETATRGTEGSAASLTDQAYMEALTLAFMEGKITLTPENPKTTLRAILVKVPEERMGSAQWFLDGVPQGEYYSASFPIYNGRMTEMEISYPYSKGVESRDLTVALEVHLHGVVRRIEKTISAVNYEDEWYDQAEKARVFQLVQPVDIEAEVRYWTHTYTHGGLSVANGSLAAGRKVVYTDHRGTSAACIWIPEEGRSCWVPYSAIRISNRDYTVYQDFSDTDKELFVNFKEYQSDSDYLIWINLERQKVNVFQGSQGKWDLIRVSTCSSGANTTPTPAGVMKYAAYGNGWFHDTYYVKPVMYLNVTRGIAMHSILFSPDGTVQDGTQGRPASHGCVRMPPDEINWLAQYIPIGTTVVVF